MMMMMIFQMIKLIKKNTNSVSIFLRCFWSSSSSSINHNVHVVVFFVTYDTRCKFFLRCMHVVEEIRLLILLNLAHNLWPVWFNKQTHTYTRVKRRKRRKKWKRNLFRLISTTFLRYFYSGPEKKENFMTETSWLLNNDFFLLPT